MLQLRRCNHLAASRAPTMSLLVCVFGKGCGPARLWDTYPSTSRKRASRAPTRALRAPPGCSWDRLGSTDHSSLAFGSATFNLTVTPPFRKFYRVHTHAPRHDNTLHTLTVYTQPNYNTHLLNVARWSQQSPSTMWQRALRSDRHTSAQSEQQRAHNATSWLHRVHLARSPAAAGMASHRT